MNVSRAIPSLDGKLVETLEADSGYFLATAYEKVPGALWDPGFKHLPEDEQATEFPWRTLTQMGNEVRHNFWGRFDFSKLA